MDDPEEDAETFGRTRWQRVAIALSWLVPIGASVAFGALIARPILSKGGWLRFGHGPREPISAATAQAILIPVGVVLGVALLAMLVRLVRSAWTAPTAPTTPFDRLGTGETLIWAGRPGLRSVTGRRLLLFALTLAAPVLFALWMWTIWSDTRDSALAAIWTVLACMLFFGSAVPAIVVGSDALREWIRDALARVCVTDRRIAWAVGRDFIYREIVGDSLIGAALIEGQGRYGWVSVTQRVGDDVRERDLFGLPEPDQALAAIERLIALRAPAAISDKIPLTGVEFSSIGR
jgi:hypothetical protein